MQYTAAGQRPRAHVPCEQRPVKLRTLPPAVATAYSPSTCDTRVCCRAHHSLYRLTANRQAPKGRHERWAHCVLVMEGNEAGEEEYGTFMKHETL